MIDEMPTARQVREVAMRYYELHPEELNRTRRNLRTKAAAPYFVVSERYQHAQDAREMISVNPGTGGVFHNYEDRFSSNREATNGILHWNIPLGVMSDSEFQSYQLSLIQRQIIYTVNTWFYSRQMLMIELLIDPPRDPRALTSLRLRVDGFTALLDIYTGGWFSRQLPEVPPELRIDSPGDEDRR